MLYLKPQSRDPFYNLALEEVIFQTVRGEDVFFLWRDTPCVVVGSYQNICREVRAAALWKEGIPILRRISGGGTVYHDLGNVNYTYIKDQPAGGAAVNYDTFLLPVIKALNAIGVPARKDHTCDIAIGQQKISGSAQRTADGRILHHGTLLFQSDLTALDRITVRHKNDCFQSRGTASAICPVTNIRDHLAFPMTMEEFEARLLEQMLSPGSRPMILTPEQEAEVLRLREEKYRSWEWIWGRTPAFTYKKSGTFAGRPIRVAYQAKRGIVFGAEIDCSAVDGAQAAQLLNGQRLEPEGFAHICRVLAGDRAKELMDLLL